MGIFGGGNSKSTTVKKIDQSVRSADTTTNTSSARYGDDFTDSQLQRDTITTSISVTESKELVSAMKGANESLAAIAFKSVESASGGNIVTAVLVGLVVSLFASYLKGKK